MEVEDAVMNAEGGDENMQQCVCGGVLYSMWCRDQIKSASSYVDDGDVLAMRGVAVRRAR